MNWFSTFRMTFPGALLAMLMTMTGCTETEPTRQDVADARETFEVERQETVEAAREADEAVREELEQERQAAEELRATEQKFQESQARDAFVNEMELQLADADEHISRLDETSLRTDDEDENAIETRVESLQSQHDRAQDALDELKGAELEKWRGHQEKVRLALHDLNSNLNGVR